MKTPYSIHLVLAIGLLTLSVRGQELPWTIELDRPGAGVSHFEPPWPGNSNSAMSFVGDVNGDGYEDWILKHGQLGSSGLFLIWGGHLADGDHDWEDIEKTYLEFGLNLEGFKIPDGRSIERLGDLDSDGFSDFLLADSTHRHELEGESIRSGLVILIRGQEQFPESVLLGEGSPSEPRMARIRGSVGEPGLGVAVSLLGDVDGSGKLDLGITSVSTPSVVDGGPHAGSVYVLLDVEDVLAESETLDIEQLGEDLPGFIIRGGRGGTSAAGDEGDKLGTTLVGVGDTNGDGLDDFLIGANSALRKKGQAVLILGKRVFPSEILLHRSEPDVVIFDGVEGLGFMGSAIAAAGDVNGDGLADFLVGAPNARNTLQQGVSGEVYLVYGQETWSSSYEITSTDLRVTRITGEPWPLDGIDPRGRDLGAVRIRSTGPMDWNQDGLDDVFLVSSSLKHGFRDYMGAGFLLFGGPHLPTVASEPIGILDIASGDWPGLTIRGEALQARFGGTVSRNAGDLDGDGHFDLLVQSTFSRPFDPVLETTFRVHVIRGGGFQSGEWSVHSLDPDHVFVGDRDVEFLVHGSGFRGTERVFLGTELVEDIQFETSSRIRLRTPGFLTEGFRSFTVERDGEQALLTDALEVLPVPRRENVQVDREFLQQGRPGLTVLPVIHRGDVLNAIPSLTTADVDGDGNDDLVVGLARSDLAGLAGRVEIFPGTDRSWPSHLFGSQLDRRRTVIQGPSSRCCFGGRVDRVGDLNQDGRAEILVGNTRSRSSASGGSLVTSGVNFILQGRSLEPGVLSIEDLLELEEAHELRYVGCGPRALSRAGDLDGDGLPEFMVGTSHCLGIDSNLTLYFPERSEVPDGGREIRWESHRLRGEREGSPNPERPDLHPRMRIFGVEASPAGDMNGDGWKDLFVLTENLDHQISYLVLGDPGGWRRDLALGELRDAGRLVVFDTYFRRSGTYQSLDHVGDFNGDGLDDVVLGLGGAPPESHGNVVVIFGSPDYGDTIQHLSLAHPDEHLLILRGEFPYDSVGHGVSAIGDLDGDGFDDIAMSSLNLWSGNSRAFVVWGTPDPPLELDLWEMRDHGFEIHATTKDLLISRQPKGVFTAGDYDGDGRRDLVFSVTDVERDEAHLVIVWGGVATVPTGEFLRGDANDDAVVDLSDALTLLGHLFIGDPEHPACPRSLDVDGGGTIELTDAIFLLGALFLGTAEIPDPYPACGPGIEVGELECPGSSCDTP